MKPTFPRWFKDAEWLFPTSVWIRTRNGAYIKTRNGRVHESIFGVSELESGRVFTEITQTEAEAILKEGK